MKRYDIWDEYNQLTGEDEHIERETADGEWCKYSEVEAEITKLKAVIKAQDAILSAYRLDKTPPDWALDCVADFHNRRE